MRNFRKFRSTALLIIFLIIGGNSLSRAQLVSDYKNQKLSIEQRVSDLGKRMTLEEKYTQVTGSRIDYGQESLPANERMGIPPFVIVHGPFGGKFRVGSSSWDVRLKDSIKL